MLNEILVIAETEHLVLETAVLEILSSTGTTELVELYEQGPPGIPGPQGPQGIPGTNIGGGLGADLNYHYAQGPASANWLIIHNLAKFPSVTVIDSAGEEVEGTIQYIDNNNLRLLFSAAFTGSAYLN